jgi:hypothetical protein
MEYYYPIYFLFYFPPKKGNKAKYKIILSQHVNNKMYSNNEGIDGENKNTWRIGEATMNYYRKLEENRQAADEAFDKLVSQQRLASIGAALELNKLAASKAPGSPHCADNCSCLYCQKTAELTAIVERGLKQEVELQNQKVASANHQVDNSAHNTTNRQPKWMLNRQYLR